MKSAIAFVLVSAFALGGDTAASTFKKAKKAEAKGDFANAYLLYSQAVALDPANPDYWNASLGVRANALPSINVVGQAATAPATPTVLPFIDQITDEERIEALNMRPPPQVQGPPDVKDLDFTGNSQELFEKVAGAFGLRVVFDGDYQPGNPARFRLPQVNYRSALRALETQTGSFVVPISPTLLMVAKDTTQKRTELEPNVGVLIPIPETVTTQELTEAANALRTLFDLTRIAIDTQRRLVYVRDRASRMEAATEAVRQLTTARGQVVIEVELLSFNSSTTTDYGVRLPSTLTLSWLGKTGFLQPTPTPTGITGMLTFGGGKSQFGIGIGDAAIFATMTDSQTRSLSRSFMRILDGQAGQLHVGDRYPIITVGYYGDTGDSGGTVYRPPPNIQFEDLGVVVKITPRVHNQEEVSLDVEAEFKSLAGETANEIPVISNRKFKSVVRVRYDEVVLVAGLVNENVSQSWSGLPGLHLIPGLRSNSRARDQGEILLTLKPRLVTLPPSEVVTTAIWSGTETKPLSLIN